MATQYTSILKLALPVQGELSGTWGDVVNDNITEMVEEAIAGRKVINTWATNSHTLTTADGTTSESRAAILTLTDTGTVLTGAGTVICPAASKIYIVENGTGQTITIKTSAGTGVAVPDGKNMVVFCDGTNVEESITNINSLTLNGDGATVSSIKDEDNMASDSATALATQQSIKAYVDSQVGTVDTLAEVLANGNTTGGTDIAVGTGDDITFADSSKAIFGAGSDLQIYHDGSNSYVRDAGQGNLRITSDSTVFIAKHNDENMVRAIPDGEVNLYHNGSEKLATTSTGIDVTGDISVTDATPALDLYDSDNSTRTSLTNNTGISYLNAYGTTSGTYGTLIVNSNDHTTSKEILRADNTNIQFKTDGTLRGRFLSNGDYVLYNDAATSTDFYWDASTSRLGLGTTSSRTKLHVSGLTGDDDPALASSTAPVFISNTANSYGLNIGVNSAGTSWLQSQSNTASTAYDISLNPLGGNVGIGTSSPSEIFEVSTATANTAYLKVGTTNNGSSNVVDSDIAGLEFYSGDTSGAGAGVKGSIRYKYGSSSGATTHMTFHTANVSGSNDVERMRIDSSGNVGIGTDSPAAKFDVVMAASNRLLFTTTGSDTFVSSVNEANAAYSNLFINGAVTKIGTGGTERMRIDSSGRAIVGKTVADNGTVGITLFPEGVGSFVADGSRAATFVRKTSDGDLVQFRKDTTTVGSIGTLSGDLTIGTGDTGLGFLDGGNFIQPHNMTTNAVRDAAVDLGTTSGRFKDIYLSGDVNLANNSQITFASTSCNIEGNSSGADFIKFTTANSEAARLDSTGNLFIGLTSEPVANEAGLMISPVGFIKCSRNGTSAKTHHQFFNDNGVVGSIVTSGTTTTYNTSSDARLKGNIADAEDAGALIDSIQVRQFDWVADGEHQRYGMVAQELNTVAPEAVFEGETEDDMMGVDYSKLVPMMLKEIQSLRARVAQLEGAN